jgi:lysyl-tRNA synthetase class 1
MSDFARIIELSVVRPLPKERLFIPRFRTLSNLLKTNTNIEEFFKSQKKSELSKEEQKILKERIKYAKIYLKNYALKDEKLPPENQTKFELTSSQIIFFEELIKTLGKEKELSREKNQEIIFNIIKQNNLKAKEIFKAFYQALIGKDFGPKAADLITELGLEKIKLKFNSFKR